uniref:Bro-N domain-containing protein n=1 Tax=Moumouvirus sp. 'Monve' TaxID=1128131 RepID=H2EF67_9VIRU|nr:hypothetical protein mv_L930 [Moumouvirus Monve]
MFQKIIARNMKKYIFGICYTHFCKAKMNIHTQNVSRRNIYSFAVNNTLEHIADELPNLTNINPKTLFINNNGLFQLISKSRNNKAIKIWNKITNDILPAIYLRGMYISSNSKSTIRGLSKKYYDDDIIKKYKNMYAIYLAYIGEYDGIHMLKIGKNDKLTKYKLIKYRKIYHDYNIIKIWDVLSNDLALKNIIKIFKNNKNIPTLNNLATNDETYLNILSNFNKLTKKINNETGSKILVLNEKYNLLYFRNIIDDIIEKTKLQGNDVSLLYCECGLISCTLCVKNKQTNNLQYYTNEIDTIKNEYIYLQDKYEILEKKYYELIKKQNLDNKYIKRLELEFKHAEIMINELKRKSR